MESNNTFIKHKLIDRAKKLIFNISCRGTLNLFYSQMQGHMGIKDKYGYQK